MLIFKALNQYPSARKFLLFSVCFYISMYISKTVHALWFDENHALAYFGVSYTMMAVAGTLSFFTGKLGDMISPSFALKLGVIVYAIGMFLRIFTHSLFVAGMSGFIAGLGASLVIISMRFWILSIGTEEERPAVVSIKEIGSNIGTTIGTAVSGVTVALLSYFLATPLLSVLILAAVCCLCTIFFIPKFPKATEQDDNNTQQLEKHSIKQYTSLVIGVIVYGIVAGLSVSLLNPFIPIILKNQGIPISLIGVFMAIVSLTSIVITPIFSHKHINQYKQWILFFCELLAGIVILLFLKSYVAWVVLAILILRAVFLTGSIITQELMELEMYPKQYLGVLFGMSQSAFFVGDALGGTLGGYVYSLNMNYALVICASFFLFNGLTFPLFFKHISKKDVLA